MRLSVLGSPFRVLAGLALVLAACSSGGSGDRDTEFRELARNGQWEELEARIEALEAQGASGPQLDFFMGWALLAQDEDLPAARRFESATQADSGLVFKVADLYRDAAARDLKADWKNRAARRILAAYRLDGNAELGELGVEVADLLFEEKDYPASIPVFRRLLAGDVSDDELRQRWSFRLGLALEQSGSEAAGLDQYRSYWKEWPRTGVSSTYQSYVLWRQGILLLDFAQRSLDRGDPADALPYLQELIDLHGHAEHRALAHYRMGLCLEELGRPDEARAHYEAALEFPSGEGGGVDEKVRERLEALRG